MTRNIPQVPALTDKYPHTPAMSLVYPQVPSDVNMPSGGRNWNYQIRFFRNNYDQRLPALTRKYPQVPASTHKNPQMSKHHLAVESETTE